MAGPPDMPPNGDPASIGHGYRLLVLLVALSSLGPLSINIIVPAIPSLSDSLEADPAAVQLAISLYFAGLACSQLVLGSLSDRFGRRPVLIAGFLITVVTSFAAAAATSVVALIIARTAQAFGASTGVVMGRAIVRDIYSRDRAASMLGWVTMSTVFVPMFGPLIGGLLDETFGWRSIFLLLGAFALITAIWSARALPETRPPHAASGASFAQWRSELRALLSTPEFLGYAFCSGTASGAYYAILGGAPHIVITQMGRSSAELGVWFLISSFGYMVGNFITGRFSIRYGVNMLMWWGYAIELVGGLLSVLLVFTAPEAGPLTIFAPSVLIYVGNGMALPNAIAGAVSVRPQAAGSASGIAGFMQMGYGAVVSQFITIPVVAVGTAMPLAWAMVVQPLAGLIVVYLLMRRAAAARP